MARLSRQSSVPVEQLGASTKSIDKQKKPELDRKTLKETYGFIYFDVLRDVTEDEVADIVEERFPHLLGNSKDEQRESIHLTYFGLIKRFDRASFPPDELGQVANTERPSKKYASDKFNQAMARNRKELITHIISEFHKGGVDGGSPPTLFYYRISEKEYEAAMQEVRERHAQMVEIHRKEREIVQKTDPDGFARIMALGREAVELSKLQKSAKRLGSNGDNGEQRVDPDLITSIFGDNAEEAELHRHFTNGIKLRNATVAKV